MAFRGSKKKGQGMGLYVPTKEEETAYKWCIRNNIKISPWARDLQSWHISVIIGNGKNNVSPVSYTHLTLPTNREV